MSSGGPTIVFTQSGARADFQARLRDRGVEVIEFPFLTPERVAQYCHNRGFLQVRTLLSVTTFSGVSQWLSLPCIKCS